MTRSQLSSAALMFALAVASPVLAHASRPLASIPFRMHDNRMLIEVTIDGKGPFTMIFDTGAGNVMTPECQERLGLASSGSDSTSGAGAARAAVSVAHVASLKLDTLEMRDQDFVVVDLSEIRRTFRFPKLDGIVGFELLERAHARVDFDRALVLLSEPARDSTAMPKGGMRIDVTGRWPVVDGRINGLPAKILIDTGDRSNLTLFRQFAASSRLDSIFSGHPEIPTGVGVGGPIPGRVANVKSVTFGATHERDIVARLPSTKAGLFATSPLSASVGTGLLQNYNLEIDYRSRSIVFEPRKGPRAKSEFVPVPKTL
jgi:hypothetical protein